MAILEFRKNELFFEQVSEGYYDKRGNWHEGSREWVSIGKCGSQPATGENPTIQIPDGSLIVYEYILHLPANCREFLYGERVKVGINGDTEKIYEVVGFQRGQLQSKLYIKTTE